MLNASDMYVCSDSIPKNILCLPSYEMPNAGFKLHFSVQRNFFLRFRTKHFAFASSRGTIPHTKTSLYKVSPVKFNGANPRCLQSHAFSLCRLTFQSLFSLYFPRFSETRIHTHFDLNPIWPETSAFLGALEANILRRIYGNKTWTWTICFLYLKGLGEEIKGRKDAQWGHAQNMNQKWRSERIRTTPPPATRRGNSGGPKKIVSWIRWLEPLSLKGPPDSWEPLTGRDGQVLVWYAYSLIRNYPISVHTD